MAYLGDFISGASVYCYWGSADGDGASITRATNGTIQVYQDGNTTQITAGVTDTEDFGSLTGVHLVIVDTSNAAYSTGHDYTIVLSGATIDGQTVNAVLGTFSIDNRKHGDMVYTTTTTELGEAPVVNIFKQQHEAFGSEAISVDEAQTGNSLVFHVFNPTTKQTIFRLTSADSEITIGGVDDKTLTITSDDAHTAQAGTYSYLLWNTTDDLVLCKGAFVIHSNPDYTS